jgi:site-specific recombinase XerD
MDIQLPLGATMDIQTLEQAIDLFVTDGMPARNLSPQTRKHYRHDLLDLLAFLNERGASTLADISLRHLEAYQAEMDRRAYSASTRNRKSNRSFTFCTAWGSPATISPGSSFPHQSTRTNPAS